MKIPEFLVTSKGTMVKKVEWNPRRDGEAIFDVTGMHVSKIERVVEPGEPPTVKVTFLARLVEVEE